MVMQEKIEIVARKKSTISSKKQKKTCLSSTTRSGIKYAIAWVAYVLIGSWIFLVLEETKSVIHVEHHKWTKFKELLTAGEVVEEILELRLHLLHLCPEHWFNSTFDELLLTNTVTVPANNESDVLIEAFQPKIAHRWKEQTEAACEGKLVIPEEVIKYPDWTFADAIYFTMTLVTTIGFGHISPTTDVGKMFCVVYALAGVPLTCIFIAKSSDVLSNRMLLLYETTKKRYRRHPKTVLYLVTWLFLTIGCFVFMYLPCIAFAYFEEWSYVDSFYFSFITLTTIGFGDYIAGYGDQAQTYPELYKIVIVIWIMIGLGYWILLLNFLQKAIKSNAKALKKSFGGKSIVKQAEFLRQVMTKVKQLETTQQPTPEEIDERLNMMALMIENMSNTTKRKQSYDRTESGINMKKSLSKTSMSALNEGKSVLRKLSTDSLNVVSKMFGSFASKSSFIFEHLPGTEEEHTIQIEEEDEDEGGEEGQEEKLTNAEVATPRITFNDLMKVNVALKTETFKEFENLVGQANMEGDADGDEGINLNFNRQTSLRDVCEVTLPLRDVLGIVLLVASMEGNDDEDEDTPSEDSQLTVTSMGPIVDPRESVPLLRNIFLSYIGDANNKEEGQQRQNPLTHQERETIKNAYFESALNTYLEECGTTPEEVFEKVPDDDLTSDKMKVPPT